MLTRFRIKALHNNRTVDIPISDNRLILVGENGTGKSTVANFLYFFLSRQFRRMLDYEFEHVVAVLDEQELVINRSDIIPSPKKRDDFSRTSRYDREPKIKAAFIEVDRVIRRIRPPDLRNHEEIIFKIASDFDVPASLLLQYFMTSIEAPHSERLLEVENKIIESSVADQILLLPTYRRIEQDLRAIFPLIADEIQDRNRRRMLSRREPEGFVELVEFGMQDVEELIKSKMDSVKDNVRRGLNELTGKYLRDVIRGSYREGNLLSVFGELDSQSIDSILSRIPQTILPEIEKQTLQETINNIATAGKLQEGDEVVAHYFAQLVELYRSQQDQEKEIRDFVGVCNQYLRGKQFSFDDVRFEITLKSENESLKMNMLSSGEKQIVSLFAHIYLSDKAGFFVVIDEPELSLSVPWQKRFLPDILKTGHCNGLVAVTHSPFVFDNELDSYTHSIEDFMESLNVVR